MVYAFLLILFLSGSGDVEIRISNQGKVAIEEVRVQFPSQTESYGTIPAKGVSEYRIVKKAYRYARIEAMVGGKPALLQPIDYVGEKELKAGKYTYVITINDNASSEYDRIRLECRKDEGEAEAELKISVANGTKAEEQTKDQLQRILKSYDLSKWIFTKTIIIDEKTTIPHSHPVLTLSVRHLRDDELLIATFVHEQAHWFVLEDQKRLAAAIKEFKQMFPKVPVGFPEGGSDEGSTYLHIAVIYLEYRAARELLGELRAKQVMHFWTTDHYTWIYKTVLERPRDIGNIMFKHQLVPTAAKVKTVRNL